MVVDIRIETNVEDGKSERIYVSSIIRLQDLLGGQFSI